jgi:NAD-dependent dihydropyrimidine dehydrogenase PreA subunit
MKTTRKIIEIDDELCDGCGQCVPSCAEGALQIIDGKARIVSDNLCDGLGACMGDCPNGALKIIERDAAEFDEEAVEKHLESVAEKEAEKPANACGCASHQIQSFSPASGCACSDPETSPASDQKSALSNWPVQIRLIPAEAPFLKNADILITADCAAVAYPKLHSHLLAGKVVMMGCPKFDNAEEYIEKFKEIFTKAGVKSLTIVSMEVPCCSGLPVIVRKGLEAAGASIPVTEIIISAQGKIISQSDKAKTTPNIQIL